MGLFDSKEFKTSAGEHFHHPPDHCFYCCNPLDGDHWIFWQGHEAQIWLHPACAKRLADNLNLDWHKFKTQHPEKV